MVTELAKLPGVGERTALRYSVSLLKSGNRRIESLQRALAAVNEEVAYCPTCFFWTQEGNCPICLDSNRSDRRLCVVRDCPDALALEKFKSHNWKYHVLQGLLAPLSGIGPTQIRLDKLFERIQENGINEVILAFDATVEGDATALFIRDQIKNRFTDVQLSRTAMGLPAGASVEYLDPSTLENALLHRTNLE